MGCNTIAACSSDVTHTHTIFQLILCISSKQIRIKIQISQIIQVLLVQEFWNICKFRSYPREISIRSYKIIKIKMTLMIHNDSEQKLCWQRKRKSNSDARNKIASIRCDFEGQSSILTLTSFSHFSEIVEFCLNSYHFCSISSKHIMFLQKIGGPFLPDICMWM